MGLQIYLIVIFHVQDVMDQHKMIVLHVQVWAEELSLYFLHSLNLHLLLHILVHVERITLMIIQKIVNVQMVIIQKDLRLMILYHVKVKYFIYLIECTLLFATCKYDNTTSSIVALTCALGTGRSTDASTNCTCISGYTEVQN